MLQAYGQAVTNSDSGVGDQTVFLQLGLDLRETGKLTDGVRNPLYAAFLALVAERDWTYFTHAKLLSMGFGILTITAVLILGWRYFNLATGLAAAYLLSINVEFTFHSATALTESLLTLVFTLAWFAMLRALQPPSRKIDWLAAGGLAGLAYLAKSSGQLIVLAFLLSALLIYGRSLGRERRLWLFLAAYLVVVSPLWLYNTVHYGSPTFNYATNHQMWMESWEEWNPADLSGLPTAFSYLQTHSLPEIVDRLWTGLKAERNILVKTLYPSRTLLVDRFLLSPLSGWTFLILALLPLLFRRHSLAFFKQHRPLVYLTGLTVILFFVLFAWYTSIIPATRFLLPIAPLLIIVGAYLISLLLANLYRRGRWGRWSVTALVVIIGLTQAGWWLSELLPAVDTFRTANLYTHDREYGQAQARPLTWLADGYPHRRIAWRSSSHLPIWAYSDRLNQAHYPAEAETIRQLTNELSERRSDFVIVDREVLTWYDDLLDDYFQPYDETLEIDTIPPGWTLTFADPGLPCQHCIFRLKEVFPPQIETDYRLGLAIQLTGYDLSAVQLQPGDTLHLTLHWLALETIAGDLTVFTQLLGPDFQLHGQQDNQPLNNALPTSRWQPGMSAADRYDLLIDASAPAGTYQLLVGMYDSQTQERVPVTHNSEPVADNAIMLATIEVLPN